jgi:hypothetical protein
VKVHFFHDTNRRLIDAPPQSSGGPGYHGYVIRAIVYEFENPKTTPYDMYERDVEMIEETVEWRLLSEQPSCAKEMASYAGRGVKCKKRWYSDAHYRPQSVRDYNGPGVGFNQWYDQGVYPPPAQTNSDSLKNNPAFFVVKTAEGDPSIDPPLSNNALCYADRKPMNMKVGCHNHAAIKGGDGYYRPSSDATVNMNWHNGVDQTGAGNGYMWHPFVGALYTKRSNSMYSLPAADHKVMQHAETDETSCSVEAIDWGTTLKTVYDASHIEGGTSVYIVKH